MQSSPADVAPERRARLHARFPRSPLWQPPAPEPAAAPVERALWETPRDVTHEEAEAAARRLVNSHFRNPDGARVSIPANPNRDDDLMLLSYIAQRARAEAAIEARVGGAYEMPDGRTFWIDAPVAREIARRATGASS